MVKHINHIIATNLYASLVLPELKVHFATHYVIIIIIAVLISLSIKTNS